MKVVAYQDVQGILLDDPGMSGVSLRVVAGPQDGCNNFVMRVFQIAPGGYTTRHAHPHEHEVFFFEGSGEVLNEDRWMPVECGSVAAINGGVEHQIKAGEQGLKFICVVPVLRESKVSDRSPNPSGG
ncbi:MAG: cupin domain-containing protein [Candidatus Alcyoniella australis]|nr:cupin domain-containing protein [Candidatus Alcyoniella australis]